MKSTDNITDKRRKNLKAPWKKGDPSPNPSGKPKGILNFKTRLEMALNILAEEYARQHNSKKENKDKQITADDVDIMGDIFRQYVNNARNGREKMITDILDRAYGKPTQPVKLGGVVANSPIPKEDIPKTADKIEKWLSMWKSQDDGRPLELKNQNGKTGHTKK